MNRILHPNGRLAVAELRNGYEAAQFYSPTRTRIFASNRDAKLDVSPGVRKRIMAQSRWLYQNVPVYSGIVEALVTYVIGSGVQPAAATSDQAWNLAAQEEWRLWSRNPELRTRLSWDGYQRLCARSVFVDGEFFVQLSRGPSSLPRIVMLEAHRITDPDDRIHERGKEAAENQDPDGIVRDATGRVRDWLVPYVAKSGKRLVHRVPEAEMVQSWLPIRAEQYRGITIFASAINTARDLDDILGYEKTSVKRLSSRIDVVETQSGELDPETVLRGMGTVSGTDPCDPTVRSYYEDVIGSETVVMRTGDKYAPVESSRPSASWQGFIDFLVQSVCQVTGVPFNVLIPVKVGGADTRRDLARAARVFETWQQSLTTGWQRIYEYVIRDAMLKGRIPMGPTDWRKTAWQFPKTVTVDYGREAKEDRADVKAGLLSLEEYWSRYGLDWRDQTAQLKTEAETVKATDEDLYERMYMNTKDLQPKDEPDAANG